MARDFLKSFIKASLLIELEKAGLRCKAEVDKDVYYQEVFVGKRKLDVIVEQSVLVELKALNKVDNSCYNQILNYLRVFKMEVALLLNFGAPGLQFKRFVL